MWLFQRVQVRLEELVHLSWSHAFHLCVCHVWQDLVHFKQSLTGRVSTGTVNHLSWTSIVLIKCAPNPNTICTKPHTLVFLLGSPSVTQVNKVEKPKDWTVVSVTLNADLRLSAQLSRQHR